MKAAKLKKLITEFLVLEEEQNKWLESINPEIRDCFFSNSLVESLHKQKDMLLRFVLDDLYDDVYWFLYEWKVGYNITTEDKDYTINSLDDFIEYLMNEWLVD